ncbi:MAG: sulfurase, partial [Pseudomonadota bacterium]
MPALMPTDFYAEIVWIGRVADRARSLASEPLDRAAITFEGIEGEAHGGLTRPSCSRVKSQHKRGTPIRNVRQLSVVSVVSAIANAERAIRKRGINMAGLLPGRPNQRH